MIGKIKIFKNFGLTKKANTIKMKTSNGGLRPLYQKVEPYGHESRYFL